MRTAYLAPIVALFIVACGCCLADETPTKPADVVGTKLAAVDAKPVPTDSGAGSEQRGGVVEQKEKSLVELPFKIGMDSVTGFSDVPGYRRYSDGMWAGAGPAYPSVAYLRYENGSGHAAKAAVGLGSLYTGAGRTLKQPVEAWWQVPAGKTSVVMGKFWVPFAAQEWQYETKPGVMLQWEEKGFGLAMSANYNERSRSANAYWRASRSLGSDSEVGLSFALGRGLSYDSVHDRAWGVDATFAWKGLRFTGEYVGMTRHAADAFGSTFGKLEYENLGAWKPFVAFYSWNDRSEEFGRFRATVYGTTFQLTPMLAIEAAVAPTSDRKTQWVQLRWAWER